MSLLIKNASQIVQVVSDKKCFLTGDDSKTLAIVEQDSSGEKLSLVVCRWVKMLLNGSSTFDKSSTTQG